MFEKFPAKMLPIIREHQYLVFSRMVELVLILVSRTLVIAETDFEALTASMNLMSAPNPCFNGSTLTYNNIRST